MIILGIETSCDETAISLIEFKKNVKNITFKVLSDITVSQIKIHQKYGGVFPAMASREHQKNLVPILKKVLEEADLITKKQNKSLTKTKIKPHYDKSFYHSGEKEIKNTLNREPELLKQFLEFIPRIKIPNIDAIAVTHGPGLEPALWIGINFAKAISAIWNIPIVPINHMEGHIFSALIGREDISNSPKADASSRLSDYKRRGYLISNKNPECKIQKINYPALALLVSGGHTELVEIKKLGQYKIIGKTRDDSVGECFDKVARMLGLPYPGGPQVANLADKYRQILNKKSDEQSITFPRPMINSKDLDFSFSGLKTSVLYFLKDKKIKPKLKMKVCYAFEEAAIDVLTAKTKKALEISKAKTLIVGGGVSANKFLRETFQKEFGNKCDLHFPSAYLSGDNALMIAVSGYLRLERNKNTVAEAVNLKAQGNLELK